MQVIINVSPNPAVKIINAPFGEGFSGGGEYSIAYGCAEYYMLPISDCVDHCQTKDGAHQWIESNTEDGVMDVIVVKGDVNTIAEMVKREVEHFDSTATINFV